jgi:hypothetical protein
MKPLLLLGSLLLAAATTDADFIIEQKLESTIINGTVLYKIKGDDARVEMPSPIGGKVTTIIKGATGEMVTLMEQQKMAMKLNMKDVQKQSEAQQKAAGMDLSAMSPKATGQKEKVGEWNTEIYELTAGGATVKMWVAKDFPNWKAIQDAMGKATKATGGGMDLSKLQPPGMTVKTETGTAMGKMTTLLVSVKEAPVPASDFVVPEGYQMMDAPAGLGGQ